MFPFIRIFEEKEKCQDEISSLNIRARSTEIPSKSHFKMHFCFEMRIYKVDSYEEYMLDHM